MFLLFVKKMCCCPCCLRLIVMFQFPGSIRVFCRVRPFLTTDWRRIREPIVAGTETIAVRSVGSRRDFRFDKVFDAGAIQG